VFLEMGLIEQRIEGFCVFRKGLYRSRIEFLVIFEVAQHVR
jgi:hypothetical protein